MEKPNASWEVTVLTGTVTSTMSILYVNAHGASASSLN